MLIVATLPSTLILYMWAVLVDSGRAGFVWVRLIWNDSTNPKSCQMPGAFCHTVSQCKWWTSSRNSQIVAVYGNVVNQQNVMKWCCEFSEGRTDVHDEQRSGRPLWSVTGGRFLWLGIQKLVPRLNKRLDNAGVYVEKWSYVQAIHSQCRFCKLKCCACLRDRKSVV